MRITCTASKSGGFKEANLHFTHPWVIYMGLCSVFTEDACRLALFLFFFFTRLCSVSLGSWCCVCAGWTERRAGKLFSNGRHLPIPCISGVFHFEMHMLTQTFLVRGRLHLAGTYCHNNFVFHTWILFGPSIPDL